MNWTGSLFRIHPHPLGMEHKYSNSRVDSRSLLMGQDWLSFPLLFIPPSARLRDMSSTVCINALYKLSSFRNFHFEPSKSAKVHGVVCLLYYILQFLILTTHSIGCFRICNNIFLVSWIACWMSLNLRNKQLLFGIVGKQIGSWFPDRNNFWEKYYLYFAL